MQQVQHATRRAALGIARAKDNARTGASVEGLTAAAGSGATRGTAGAAIWSGQLRTNQFLLGEVSTDLGSK